MTYLVLPIDNKVELGDINNKISKVLWQIVFEYLEPPEHFILNRLSIFCYEKDSDYVDHVQLTTDCIERNLLECFKYCLSKYLHFGFDLEEYIRLATQSNSYDVVSFLITINNKRVRKLKEIGRPSKDYAADLLNYANSTKMIDVLIEHGVKQNYTAMLSAIIRNRLDILKYLYSQEYEMTTACLFRAIKNNNTEMMEFIYRKLGHTTPEDDRYSLALALENGDKKCVELVLTRQEQHVSGHTLLALETRDIDKIKLIFDRYTDVIDDVDLVYAVEHCNIDIVKYLFNKVGYCSNNVFISALDRDDEEIIRYLEELGVRN